MRRTVLALAGGISHRLPRFKAVMVTLTYAPGCEWSPLHISAYLDCVRKWAERQGVDMPYVWVAELQLLRVMRLQCTAAEAVHYHVLFWLPRKLSMPKADKRGWWKHGATRTEVARHAPAYMSKYATKGQPDGLSLPRGIRLHGSGKLDPVLRQFRAWWSRPLYCRAAFRPGTKVDRAMGGFVDRNTGEHARSPCAVHLIRGPSGRREAWIVPREGIEESALDNLYQGFVLLSSNHAAEAGYCWLDVKTTVRGSGHKSSVVSMGGVKA